MATGAGRPQEPRAAGAGGGPGVGGKRAVQLVGCLRCGYGAHVVSTPRSGGKHAHRAWLWRTSRVLVYRAHTVLPW